MIHNNLFRSGTFHLMLFLFFAALTPQAKANFFIINNDSADKKECDEDGDYYKREDLLSQLDKFGFSPPEISCFKHSIAGDEKNIIVIYPAEGDANQQNFLVRTRVKAISYFKRETEQITSPLQQPIKIQKAGDIFPLGDDLNQNITITKDEFETFLSRKNKSFVRLIQTNLNRRYRLENTACDANQINKKGFDTNGIDGIWGIASQKALTLFMEFCREPDAITAKMISGFLLPQFFVLAKEPAAGINTNLTSNQMIQPGLEDNKSDIEKAVKEADTALVDGEKPSEEKSQEESKQAETTKEDEIVELKQKLDEAKLKIEILKQEKLDLQKANNAAEQTLKNYPKKSVFELWEVLGISFVGEMPNGNRVEGLKIERQNYCKLSADKNLQESAIMAYTQRPGPTSCFEYSFTDAEVNSSKPPFWDEATKKIIVPLLPMRIKIITSITTDTIQGLDEKNYVDCGITLTFLDDRGNELMSLPAGGNDGTGIFSHWDSEAQGAILRNLGTVSDRNIYYESFSVVLKAPEFSGQKCVVSSNVPVPILFDEYTPSEQPQALVDSEGNLSLHSFPIEVAKGATLVAFFDTNVGFPGQEQYAFNQSLDDPEIADLQKIYFSGIIEGLKKYLQIQSEYEQVLVYQSIGTDEAQTSAYFSNFKKILDRKDIQQPSVRKNISSFLDQFKVDFIPGQKGSFSNKDKLVREIMTKNNPVKFVSFGGSGLDHTTVCDAKSRAPFDSNFLTFDIWDLETLGDLLDADAANRVPGKVFYMCAKNDKLYGLKVNRGITTETEISGPLAKFLKNSLEY